MKANKEKPDQTTEKQRCGIIMPISTIDGCPETHWSDVRDILFEAIEEAGFEPNLVSDADDVGIIQKRIIQNVYENPIVVCDVSGKNPNVMFELGLRLAFDKPTIIIKDNLTSYSFDTSPIEHLTYPRDLRFNQIIDFKAELIEKIIGTHKKASEDPTYTTFLKHFGSFTIAKLDTKEMPQTEYILEELHSLRKLITDITTSPQRLVARPIAKQGRVICIPKATREQVDSLLELLKPFGEFELKQKNPNHFHIKFPAIENDKYNELLKIARTKITTARIMAG